MGKIKWTYEKIKKYIEGKEGNNCKLLMTEEEFEEEKIKQEKNNSIVELKILCGQCGKEVFYCSLNRFKTRNKKQCNDCGIESNIEKQRTDGNIVLKKFEEVGLKPLFKSEEYINNSQSLPCICIKHKDKGVQYKTYNKIRINRGCKWCGIEKQSGENSYLWKGGISTENEKIRHSLEYKEWREQVFERDKYTCQCCGQYGGKLQAHHLENFSDNEELRFDVDNGITLCKNCHHITIKGSFHNIYGTYNNTKEQLEEYINNYNKIKLIKF